MKTWSTESNGRGDLYTDETPIPALTISQQFKAMERTYRSVPREKVNTVLEALGLR